MQGLSIFLFDIVSRIMWFCKLYTHQVTGLFMKFKFMILRPLKGKVGYELSTSKLSNSDMADNVIAFQYIPPSSAFIFAIPKFFAHVFNREGQSDASLGFLRERFSRSIENNNHNRIIYRSAISPS